MRWICLPMGLLMMMLLPAWAGHSAPKVMLRINVQTTGEGLSAMQAIPIRIPPTGETIQIHTLPEVTERDLIDAQPNGSGGIRLFFNHDGQASLSAATAQNQGRILVVLINGVVVYAPMIDQQITTGQLDLPHPMNPQVLTALQEIARGNVKQANRT
jgi:hypothetical protein